MTHASAACFGVFSDEVFSSSDLARQTKHVLNTAKIRPVTVSRDKDQFALVSRETVSTWIGELNALKEVVNVVSEAGRVVGGSAPSETYHWLTVFESDDLHKMTGEILEAARLAIIGRANWIHIGGLIHEWEESALVAQSVVLDHAMFSQESLTLLPEPLGERQTEEELESEYSTRT